MLIGLMGLGNQNPLYLTEQSGSLLQRKPSFLQKACPREGGEQESRKFGTE